MMKKAAKLNCLLAPKLSFLLSRCFFILCSFQDYSITDDEKVKLSKSLNTSQDELEELLQIIKSIVFECIQNTIQPLTLKDLLVKEGLEETLAQIFCDQWAENGKAAVNRVKKTSLSEWEMKGMSWQFHAEASSSNTARQKHPIAVFNISLHEPHCLFSLNDTRMTPDKSKEVTFQMDKKELYRFYGELEKIQSQLELLKQ